MQRIYDFIKKCGGTYYLATIDGDQPRVRPFGTLEFIDGKLCMLTAKSKPVSKQIHDNPKVELCASQGGSWIRVQAFAVEDPRVESQEKMLDLYPDLKAFYQPGDGNVEILKLESGVAVISSTSEAPVTIRF